MSRYYHAIKNLFTSVKLVCNPRDLEGIDILFIPDPHFHPHKMVWNNSAFISKCNLLGVKVVASYGEKILNSIYSEATILFEAILSFNNITYYLWDVDDSLHFNRKVVRYCPSKFYADKVKSHKKLNKCIFVGKIQTPHYSERREVLKSINRYVETDIVENLDGDWQDYLNLYSTYKYSLCPISGDGNGLAFRFYESLLAGCIPIQQVRDNTLEIYSRESKFNDCVFFKRVEDLSGMLEKLSIESSTSRVWLEDELLELLKEDGIL